MRSEDPFAHRTDWKLTPNAISSCRDALEHSGIHVIDLTESNPTRCKFTYPQKEILAALSHPGNMSYVPSAQGLREAREAICAYYKRQNRTIDSQHIFLTASTSEAYSFLFRLLANSNERIVMPRPSYPLFEYLLTLHDLQQATYPLVYEERWRPDLEKCRLALSQETSAMVLINPNNPTGSFYSTGDLVVINGLCREFSIPIISDEVFHDFIFDKEKTYPTLINNDENLTFVLGGLSKALGLPQMKVSWIVVSGPRQLVSQSIARLEVIADTYLSVNTPSQNALPQWFNVQENIQNQINQRIRTNRQYIMDAISTQTDCQCLHAEGGWYAIVKLLYPFNEERLVLTLLEKDHVFVHPGYFFDFIDEPYIIVSLLPEEEVFKEGVTRVIKRIASIHNSV